MKKQTSLHLRPFFPYFGSKWRIAGLYPRPKYRQIIEPFAGSAGYSLAYHWHDVTLIDADDNIADVWDYLIHVSSSEVLSIPDVPAGTTVDDVNLTSEQKKLVGFWLNATPTYPCKRLTANAAKYPTHNYWGDDVKFRIASQVGCIRHWRVKHGIYCSQDNATATWFIDPPYHRSGKAYRFGSKRLDYEQLGEWCSVRNGQAIVCEQDGARWLPFCALASTRAMAGRSNEVVWLNE